MYFRISDVSPPYAGGFEEEGAWVVAIGLNFQVVDVSYYYLNAYIFDFSGGGNFTYGTWSPTLTEVFDGNNFFAVFVSGGTYYYGMLNRAQLRAGVIQPVYALAFSGPDSGWWYNSISTACARWEVTAQTAGNTYLLLGWDEYLVRGYDIPNGARLYGYGDTATRNQVTNSGSQQTVDGRIFE